MDCEKNKELMLKYLEETISDEEMLELDLHIKKCSECQEEFETYKEISNEIQNPIEIQENDISIEFENNVMQRISGIEFKTEKLLILIIGITTILVGGFMFVEVAIDFFTNTNQYDLKKFLDSNCFIDNIVVFTGNLQGSILRMLGKFFLQMKEFNLFVVTAIILGRFIYSFFNRGEKNVRN